MLVNAFYYGRGFHPAATQLLSLAFYYGRFMAATPVVRFTTFFGCDTVYVETEGTCALIYQPWLSLGVRTVFFY